MVLILKNKLYLIYDKNLLEFSGPLTVPLALQFSVEVPQLGFEISSVWSRRSMPAQAWWSHGRRLRRPSGTTSGGSVCRYRRHIGHNLLLKKAATKCIHCSYVKNISCWNEFMKEQTVINTRNIQIKKSFTSLIYNRGSTPFPNFWTNWNRTVFQKEIKYCNINYFLTINKFLKVYWQFFQITRNQVAKNKILGLETDAAVIFSKNYLSRDTRCNLFFEPESISICPKQSSWREGECGLTWGWLYKNFSQMTTEKVSVIGKDFLRKNSTEDITVHSETPE